MARRRRVGKAGVVMVVRENCVPRFGVGVHLASCLLPNAHLAGFDFRSWQNPVGWRLREEVYHCQALLATPHPNTDAAEGGAHRRIMRVGRQLTTTTTPICSSVRACKGCSCP
jgi:hypothetical protein